MSEDNQLVKAEAKVPIAMSDAGIQLRSYDELARFCVAVMRSGMAPKQFNSPEAIAVAIQAGMEVGLKPFQALQGIAVINNRPSLFGDAAMAVVTAHAECEGIEESLEGEGDKAVATCTVRRKGRLPIKRTFSVPDAKLAKLWGKDGPWQTYPKRMLQMRARSWAMRDSFPDALKGIGIAEEQEDIPAKPVQMRQAKAIVLPGDPEPKPAPGLSLEAPEGLTQAEKDEIERREQEEAKK